MLWRLPVVLQIKIAWRGVSDSLAVWNTSTSLDLILASIFMARHESLYSCGLYWARRLNFSATGKDPAMSRWGFSRKSLSSSNSGHRQCSTQLSSPSMQDTKMDYFKMEIRKKLNASGDISADNEI